MAPSCCLIFNLHYMGGGTQESVVFSQKKAMLTKDTIKDGVFTCLIKMNYNWKSKGGFGNAANCGLKKSLFRNLKVILLDDEIWWCDCSWATEPLNLHITAVIFILLTSNTDVWIWPAPMTLESWRCFQQLLFLKNNDKFLKGSMNKSLYINIAAS